MALGKMRYHIYAGYFLLARRQKIYQAPLASHTASIGK